jgi:phenolic acid decarboxylase
MHFIRFKKKSCHQQKDELVHGHIYEVWVDGNPEKTLCLKYYNKHCGKFVSYKIQLDDDDGYYCTSWRKVK